MLPRRKLLKGLGAAAAASPAVSAQRQKPPNVILVITDDQGYGDLSCHGNPYLKTPHLDRLHGESVRFTDFHVDPLCAPTRAALLTGRYAFRNGVTAATGGWSLLREGQPTMADLFRANGYETGIFGKWHLGDNYPFRPTERGFRRTLVCKGGGVAQSPDYWGNDYFDDTYWEDNRPQRTAGYCTDVFFEAGLQFVEENRNRPFFLFLPTNAPHSPYLVDEKYAAPYRARGVPAPTAEFYGMIANIDENVGRLMRRLRELELEQSTILIFMTDNGSSAGPRNASQPAAWPGFGGGMRASKGSPYEGGHRVPFFLRWPGAGWKTGRDISALTAHIDVLPTLAELCRLKKPKNPGFDGSSMAPLIRGGGGFPSGRFHFIQHHQVRIDRKYQMEDPRPWRMAAALQDGWRLVNGTELYDVRRDPQQQQDLSARHPEVAARLRAAYERWYQEVSPQFAVHNRIVVGSPREPLSRLTCFDWHGEEVPSNQQMVKDMLVANGYWSLRAEKAGRYEFTLRQRPPEAPAPIDGDSVKIRVGGKEQEKPVPAGAAGVSFEALIEQGEFRLETAVKKGNESRGAYYVDVRRIEES